MDAEFVRDTLGMLRRFPAPAVQGVATLIQRLAGDRAEEFCLWITYKFDEWGGPKWLRDLHADFDPQSVRRDASPSPAAPPPVPCPRCDNLGYVVSERGDVIEVVVEACSCPLGSLMTPEGLQIEREVRNRPRAPERSPRKPIQIDQERLRSADWQAEKKYREEQAASRLKQEADQREAEIEELHRQEEELLRARRAQRESESAARTLNEGDNHNEKPPHDVCAA